VRLRRVLFVCIGNSCRSQMAEGFARAYGSDVMVARSAGLSPGDMVSPLTQRLMREKNIDLSGCVPKGMPEGEPFDLIINMSGRRLPGGIPGEVRVWNVPDPIFLDEEDHRAIRDQIESLVQGLVLELRGKGR